MKQHKQQHDHHLLAIFLVFCFIAVLGVIVVFYQTGEGVTGAYTAYSPKSTITYTKCTDNDKWILLENDAGWKRIKKDICTGVDNKFLRKVSCVLKNDPESADYGEYSYTWTGIAACDSGKPCALDENGIGHC